MITLLKINPDETYDIISDTEVFIGDEFVTGWDSTAKKQQVQIVNNIHEQRKERGTWEDESKRNTLAHILLNNFKIQNHGNISSNNI